jgi:hypothetical protein
MIVKRPVFFALCWLLLLCTACGAAMEQSQVSNRFQTVFGCQPDRVVTVAGGYRVEGCGVVAHYRCIDDDQSDPDHGILADVIAEAAFDSDPCIMEHSDRSAPMPRAEPTVLAERDDAGARTLKARLLIQGGRLTAFGKPAQHPEHALLVLRSVGSLAGTCTAELFKDGEAVAIEKTERVSDHEVRVLVRLESLRGVQHALRFAGNLCGLELELDEERRQQLGLFYIRVSEELARLKGPSSGGELRASAR